MRWKAAPNYGSLSARTRINSPNIQHAPSPLYLHRPIHYSIATTKSNIEAVSPQICAMLAFDRFWAVFRPDTLFSSRLIQ
jgi:hypothetical protein